MSFRSRLLLIATFAVVALVCARLGFWQLARLRERREANAVALAARAAPPVTLDPKTVLDSALEGRRLRVTGRYDHTYDIVLRGRVYNGSPGVEIVSPLVLEDGRTAVLVNRGFLPTPDAVTIQTDSVREFGQVHVEGAALMGSSEGGEPLERGGRTTWARLNLTELGAGVPYELAPFYIRQSPNPALPPFPRRLDPVSIDDGSHLGYAIQWFAFALMAVAFGVVVWRQRRLTALDHPIARSSW